MRNRSDLPTPRYLLGLAIGSSILTLFVGLPLVLMVLGIVYGSGPLLSVIAGFFVGIGFGVGFGVLYDSGALGRFIKNLIPLGSIFSVGTHRLGT
jgi:hypothetical protein